MTPQEEIETEEMLFTKQELSVACELGRKEIEKLRSQLSTALSEALALRVENERLKATLETVVKNIDHCRPGSPNWIESNLYTVMLDIDKALSQPTPTNLTDKLLRLVVAAYKRDKTMMPALAAVSYRGPESDADAFFRADDDLNAAVEALTPDEINMIEVILK